MQAPGRKFAAEEISFDYSKKQSRFSLDIANAYPETAGIKEWKRSFVYNRKREAITLTDEYRLSNSNVPQVFNFMTSTPPRIDTKTHTIWLSNSKSGEAVIQLKYPENLKATHEKIVVEDVRLKSAWGEEVYRIQLREEKAGKKGAYEFTFSKK